MAIDAFLPVINATFNGAALRKAQRARGLSNGCMCALDALNRYCWPRQAAPDGSPWRCAVTGGGDAVVSASVGWDAVDRGFVFNNAASTDTITLPAPFTPTKGLSRRLFMFAFRHDAQLTGTGGNIGIMAASSAGAVVYGMYATRGATGQTPIVVVGPGGFFIGQVGTISNPPAPGSVVHVAIDLRKLDSGADAGKYAADLYVNKVRVGSVVTPTTDLPDTVSATFGTYSGLGGLWAGKLLAAVADPVTDTVYDPDLAIERPITAAEVVARHYDDNIALWR